jgi:hypothetical protein
LEYSKTANKKPPFPRHLQLKPAKESKPKPKKQPKTSPEQNTPKGGRGPHIYNGIPSQIWVKGKLPSTNENPGQPQIFAA